MRLKADCSRGDLVQFLGFVRLYCSGLEDSAPIDEVHNFLDEPRSSNASRHLELLVRKALGSVDIDAKHPNFIGTNEEFISRTLDFVKLAHSCWFTADRPLKGIIIVCAYFCFLSLCPNPIITLYRFCRVFNLSYRKGKKRHGDVKKMLFKLGQRIPLTPVTREQEVFIHRHLHYILKNSNSIRKNMLPNIHIKNEFYRREYIMYRMGQRVRGV
ncbi:hypothetical protein NPIL_579011 [Nephila pilipes]|uniref:BRF2-like C-terminal domain-containing protein n=1 Tax=Nephila pilipes TaxID=299642 RepID=A0A8X6N7K0_NEPPI|nr:hypothetical protein NPIL_579011 [Nephila pilipes]